MFRKVLLLILLVLFFTGLWSGIAEATADTPLLIRLCQDVSHDGVCQASEPAAQNFTYALLYQSDAEVGGGIGVTDEQGYIKQNEYAQGRWVLSGEALDYTFDVGEVTGAAVMDVPVGPRGLFLATVSR